MSPPQTMEPPSAGCSVEDLRLYVLQIVQQQSLDVTNLEVRITESVNPIQHALGKCVGDVNVFAAIKHYVTDTELENRTASISENLKAFKVQ